jgi:hypothetical protein
MTPQDHTLLKPKLSPGAKCKPLPEGGWHLEIPSGPQRSYRLAQLDDYADLPRKRFPWNPPVRLSLRGRASHKVIPGTWGFGLWNDPFSFSLGLGGASRHIPALPNAAWFFFASPPNYLSFQDDLPAQGALASTFRSPSLPGISLTLGAPALPFTFWPTAARLLRRLGARIIQQDSTLMTLEPTDWHNYRLDWLPDRVSLSVDGQIMLETGLVPRPPLGLVIWVDNQYAALPPDGRLAFGSLANPEPAWIEIAGLKIT